jgi:hypothetical protein
MRRVRVVAAVAFAALAAAPAPAHAYEFWLRAQSIGQAYQLQGYSLVGPDVLLSRHRFTQTLALRITDIGDFSHDRLVSHLPDRGLRVSFQSYLRIDHDFGEWTAGQVRIADQRVDAIDVIPELAESSVGLEMLYGYLQLDGLFDDKLQVQVGRVLADDGWGTTAVDGGRARYEVPNTPIAVTATGGLRVRASSPLGVSAYELDGTSGAGCQEYVEGPTAGTGSWQLIDRNRAVTNQPTTSDYEYCPQRDVNQPSIGVQLATVRLPHVEAEVGYRRTWSDTVGLIGPVDRLDYPDLGLYPNDYGQAPATGVNEERLWARARVHANLGETAIEPYADIRYSIVNAVVDRGDLGVRVQHGASTFEPSLEYFFPTFDADSIFNVFSISPTTDARLAYTYAPAGAHATRALASAWLRHYADVDDGETSYAGGGDASLDHPFGERAHGKLTALADGGYGGRRAGGSVEAAWRPFDELWLRARALVLAVREDELAYHGNVNVVTSSTVLSSTYQLGKFAALHVIGEVDDDAIHALQMRLLGVLDLAFAPEQP